MQYKLLHRYDREHSDGIHDVRQPGKRPTLDQSSPMLPDWRSIQLLRDDLIGFRHKPDAEHMVVAVIEWYKDTRLLYAGFTMQSEQPASAGRNLLRQW